MEALPLFLLLAAVFISVLVASAAHADHRHERHADQTVRSALAADPVCGMTVDPDEAYNRRYAGRTYHFCSMKCLDRFEVNPDGYQTRR